MPQTTPAPIPVARIPQQTGELAMLKDQLTALAHQLERSMKLRAQIAEKIAAVDGSTRTALEQQLSAAEVETGAIQAQVERVAAQIAEVEVQRHVPQVFTEVPPPFEPRGPFGISPDAITAVFVLFSIGIIVPLSIGLARRMWRRAQPPAPREAEVVSRTRLDRLEQAVDTIAIEIERISEGQRFVTRVLSERSEASRQASGSDAASALNEGKPFLALGAGPIEAMPVVQRQAVKPSITPH